MDLNRYEIELLIKGLDASIRESQRELNKRNKYIKQCKDPTLTSKRRAELFEVNRELLAKEILKEQLIKELTKKLSKDV